MVNCAHIMLSDAQPGTKSSIVVVALSFLCLEHIFRTWSWVGKNKLKTWARSRTRVSTEDGKTGARRGFGKRTVRRLSFLEDLDDFLLDLLIIAGEVMLLW